MFAKYGATGNRVDITLAGRSKIENSLADGIFVETTVNTVAGRPLVTLGTGTTIRGSGRHGLALVGSSAGNTGIELALDGAIVADNAGAGIDIESGQACRVRNATITGNAPTASTCTGAASAIWAAAPARAATPCATPAPTCASPPLA